MMTSTEVNNARPEDTGDNALEDKSPRGATLHTGHQETPETLVTPGTPEIRETPGTPEVQGASAEEAAQAAQAGQVVRVAQVAPEADTTTPMTFSVASADAREVHRPHPHRHHHQAIKANKAPSKDRIWKNGSNSSKS